MKAETYHACPSCSNDVGGLYGRFVDPSNPVKGCPECGHSITKMRDSNGLRFVFNK